MAYVYSKLANGQAYTVWKQTDSRAAKHIVEKQVIIKGGADIARGKMGEFYTPKGVRTEVSDDEIALLKQNPIFQLHEKNGHVEISDYKANADKVGKNLKRDESSQKTEKDFPKGENAEGNIKHNVPQPTLNKRGAA